jgi:hypothetical protein
MENKVLTVNLLLEILKSINAAGYGDKPVSIECVNDSFDWKNEEYYARFVRPIVDKDKNIIEYEISNC